MSAAWRFNWMLHIAVAASQQQKQASIDGQHVANLARGDAKPKIVEKSFQKPKITENFAKICHKQTRSLVVNWENSWPYRVKAVDGFTYMALTMDMANQFVKVLINRKNRGTIEAFHGDVKDMQDIQDGSFWTVTHRFDPHHGITEWWDQASESS